jgi:MFS family permease
MLMVGNAVASAFGGLMALAIAGIKTSNGYHGWRWIFIIEGIMTSAGAIICYFFLPNWPKTTTWLSDTEKQVLAERIRSEGSVGRMDRLDASAIKRCLADYKTYVW